ACAGMFIFAFEMYIILELVVRSCRPALGATVARTRKNTSHKHFRLDARKIRRAQKVLKTKTETETIERALDAVLTEDLRDRIVAAANKKFITSGIVVRDVYGKMAE